MAGVSHPRRVRAPRAAAVGERRGRHPHPRVGPAPGRIVRIVRRVMTPPGRPSAPGAGRIVRERSRARPAAPQGAQRHEPLLHLTKPARPGEVERGEPLRGLEVEEVAVRRMRAVHRPSHHQLRRPQGAPRARGVKQGVAVRVRGARHHAPLERVLQLGHIVSPRRGVRLRQRDIVAAEGFVGGGRTLTTTFALPPLPPLGSASRGERAGAAREVAPVPDRREPAHVNCVPNSFCCASRLASG